MQTDTVNYVGLNFMLERVEEFLLSQKAWADVNPARLRLMLVDYFDIFSLEGVNGLYGFLRYGITNGLSEAKITATLSHDICGRLDKMMEPRTVSYSQFKNL